MKLLFIGNSYTYYNDMPTAIFKEMAESAGENVSVTAITNGGHTLAAFAKADDAYGAKVASALTGDERYDYVILQEQSLRPAFKNAAVFYDAVRNLAERIRRTGAEPILYSTWGRKEGCSTLTTYSWTNESMTWKLAAAYRAIGEELHIRVAYAGLAFYDVYTGNPDIELYNADLSHPSYAGSFLAAATLCATLFASDPTAFSYQGALSKEQALILYEAARKAVFATPPIPDEYKTSSEGVTNV